MSSKHSREPKTPGRDARSGGERARGRTGARPRPNESETGFENREDYAPGPKRPAFFVLRRTVREFLDDGGTDLAAALTYYSVLAIFPALIALMALVGVFGQTQESIDAIMEILAPLVTADTLCNRIETTLIDLASLEGARVTADPGSARRSLGRLRVRRRLQPRDEPYLRGQGGPAVLAAAAEADLRHGDERGALRGGAVHPDHQRPGR